MKLLPLNMPSIKTITPILGGSYYHIFNRGVNKQNIFFQENNYIYFLNLIKKYLTSYVDILAYCLLPNHFHLIVKVKEEVSHKREERTVLYESKKIQNGSLIGDEVELGKIVSNQFKKMFISYAMAINKQENRVGALFDAKFKRLEITKQEYLEYAIFYVHYNPEKHFIDENFKDYKYSSFKTLCSKRATALNRKLVYEIYGDKEDFLLYHKGMHLDRREVIME